MAAIELEDLSDEALMRRVQNDDPDAFGQLYDRRSTRPQASSVAVEDLPAASSRSAFDEAMERSDRKALDDHLGRLPEAQAEVITLAYFGGMTHTEVAEALDLPAGTVKGRMRLGMEKLRRDLRRGDSD